MTSSYMYRVYTLVIRLPFPCSILPVAPIEAVPDVVVEDGAVAYQLAAPLAEDLRWQAEPSRFLWRGGPRAGRFLVEDGQHITLHRGRAVDDEFLAYHFLDAVLAAVLRQRGWLVLHANAAVTPHGAVVISGESGAGKSTTLAALLQQGCTMLADDITALRLRSDGCVEALPGVPQLHLSKESAAGLGQDISDLPRHRRQRLKAAVPAQSIMAEAPATLRALYVLRSYSGEGVRVTALSGAQKFAALQECIYGPLLPEDHPGQFPLFAAMTDRVAVFGLERPIGRWSIDEVVKVILNG